MGQSKQVDARCFGFSSTAQDLFAQSATRFMGFDGPHGEESIVVLTVLQNEGEESKHTFGSERIPNEFRQVLSDVLIDSPNLQLGCLDGRS